MASQNPGPDYSEPEYLKSKDRAKAVFYHHNIDHKLGPETRELLEKYSHVPPEEQSEHIHRIRDQAWAIRPYPCTGIGAWLTPQLCRLPIYDEVLQRVQDGAILMDVGTFIGHDLRRLVYDGMPSENLYGIDIVSHFDVGYDCFRDREKFKGHFIEADILSTTTAELEVLKGRVDIVLVSQVLHQWNWDGQLKAAKILSAFTKPGAMVVGNQIANPRAEEVTLEAIKVSVWRHDPESFAKLWEQVGTQTGTMWETQGWLRSFDEMGWEERDAAWMEKGVCLIEFVARRMS